MGRLKFLPLFLSLAASSACSQNPVVPTPETTHQQPAVAAQPAGNAKEEAPKPAPVASNLPKQELTPDVLYEFLVSEIAGQRGMLSTAKEGYLDLAKKTQDPRLAQRAAEIAVFTRDQPAALEASKLWVKLDPNTPRASQTVAALLLGQGKIDEAIPYLESYLKGEEGPSAFLHLPMMFSKVKDTDKALEAVKKLAQNYPQSPEAQYAIAQTAANAGKTDEALDALTQADKLRPGWEPAALMRSQSLARRSKAEGLAFMKDFIAGHPQARDVRLAYARLLVNANQYAEARQQFNELMTELPANPDITLASGL